MRLRSSDPHFLALVDAWWRQMLPRLAPLAYSRGGPIILVQVHPSIAALLHSGSKFRHSRGVLVLSTCGSSYWLRRSNLQADFRQRQSAARLFGMAVRAGTTQCVKSNYTVG